MFNFFNLILFVIKISFKNGLKCTHFREEPKKIISPLRFSQQDKRLLLVRQPA